MRVLRGLEGGRASIDLKRTAHASQLVTFIILHKHTRATNERTMLGVPLHVCTCIRHSITYDRLYNAYARIVRHAHHTRSSITRARQKRQIVRVPWRLRLTTDDNDDNKQCGDEKTKRLASRSKADKRLWYRVACSSTWTMQGRLWRKETNIGL